MIDQLSQFFASKGYAPHQIAGILGNLDQESKFNPLAKGDGGMSFGLAQWNRDRLKGLQDFAAQNGTTPDDIMTQAAYIDHELNTSESGAGKALKAAQDIPSATAAFLGFERPQGYNPKDPSQAHGWENRLNAAIKFGEGKQYADAGNVATDATFSDTFDVELPDGTIVQDVPPGTTQKQLLQMLEGYQVPQEQEDTSFTGKVSQAWEQRSQHEPTVYRDDLGRPTAMSSVRQIGNLAGYGADVLSSGVDYLAENAPEGVKRNASALGQYLGDSAFGRGVLGAKTGLEALARQHPLAAENLSAVSNIAAVTPPARALSKLGISTARTVGPTITESNIARGLRAAGPDELAERAASIKAKSSAAYQQMRETGANFNPSASQNIVSSIEKAIVDDGPLNKELHRSTLAVLKDLKNEKNLSLEQLDQYRQLFGDVAGNYTDKVNARKASLAIRAIDDAIDKVSDTDLTSGNRAAIDALQLGRQEYRRARKFETIADIVRKSDGDINYVKRELKKIAENPKKHRGYTTEELKALDYASRLSTPEAILKILGKAGFDQARLGAGFGALAAGNLGYMAGGGPVAIAIPAIGTGARYGAKLIGRAKTDRLLDTIEGSALKNYKGSKK